MYAGGVNCTLLQTGILKLTIVYGSGPQLPAGGGKTYSTVPLPPLIFTAVSLTTTVLPCNFVNVYAIDSYIACTSTRLHGYISNDGPPLSAISELISGSSDVYIRRRRLYDRHETLAECRHTHQHSL